MRLVTESERSFGWSSAVEGKVQSGGAIVVVLVRGKVELARWPLSRQGRPPLEVVDALARLALVAGRLRCSIRVCDADPKLAELVELVGLTAVLGLPEVGGKPEGGEEPGVEEVVVADDPTA